MPLVLTIEELMRTLNIGRNAAYELVRSKRIRSIKIGKRVKIPKDAVKDFLNGQ